MNSATGFPEKRRRLEAFNLVASGGLTDSEKRIIKFEKALETIRAEESHIKDFVESTKWFDLNGEEFLQLHYSDPCAKIFEGFAIRAGGSRVVEISLGHRSLTGLYIRTKKSFLFRIFDSLFSVRNDSLEYRHVHSSLSTSSRVQ